jgi:hypothetical protein
MLLTSSILSSMRLSTLLVTTALIASLATATACSKNNSSGGTTTTPSCTVTAGTPSTTTFGAEGGTGSVAVTAGAGCAWTAASNASFITVGQGATGNGNGTVQFTVAANTGADRTGTMTIGGTTVTITQRAPTATSVTLAAPTPSSPVGGQTITGTRPTLVVTNAVATGNAGTVTYRFEVSDQSSFPNDPARTFSVDGVAQGSGTTSGVIPRDLGPAVLWYWHARATNGTVTSAYSATETFRTASPCTYVLSATSLAVAGGGGSPTVTVTTDSSCSWTASSNASFITVASGASGTGNGTVTLAVAANAGPSRSGTVTIAGQTVTVTQTGSGLSVGFRLLDPGRGPGATTECQIRSLTSGPTTCVLESTSFPLGTTSIASYAWTVQYVYPFQKTLTQIGSNSVFSFGETCGQNPSSASGEPIDMIVTLTVTDTAGESVTVRSGAGSQPALLLRTFICGI